MRTQLEPTTPHAILNDYINSQGEKNGKKTFIDLCDFMLETLKSEMVRKKWVLAKSEITSGSNGK